jgi:hypothetical protein
VAFENTSTARFTVCRMLVKAISLVSTVLRDDGGSASTGMTVIGFSENWKMPALHRHRAATFENATMNIAANYHQKCFDIPKPRLTALQDVKFGNDLTIQYSVALVNTIKLQPTICRMPNMARNFLPAR